MKLVKEFQEFISRGNVVDLAVGVIIGGAFGRIVTSLVEDLIMPPIGMILGGVNFEDLKIVLKSEYVNSVGKVIPAVSLNYGNFIQITINFLIISAAIFAMLKVINRIKRKADAEKKQEKKEGPEVLLLREIRDLLKK